MKHVICPYDLLDVFAGLVHSNTVNNIETIGILFGESKQDNQIHIRHLHIPQQTGKNDSCQITEDGYQELTTVIEDSNLIQIGWIHTHPQWDVFMSSVDLHTQFSLQNQLAESVAIVVNPAQNIGSMQGTQACFGGYHLTPVGMTEIGKCSTTGFHLHNDGETLYQTAAHLQVDRGAKEHTGFDYTVSDKLQMYIDHRTCSSWPWKRMSYGLCIPVPVQHSPVPPIQPKPASMEDNPESTEDNPASTEDNPEPGPPTDTPSSTTRQVPGQMISFVPPPPTSRPELLHSYGLAEVVSGTGNSNSSRPTSTPHIADHDYDYEDSVHEPDLVERGNLVFRSCLSFIEAEAECAIAIVEVPCFKESLCKLENSLVSLCSAGLADGMMYAVTFAIDKKYTYTRYMDFGIMAGSFSIVQDASSSNLMDVKWQVMTRSDFVNRKKVYFEGLKKTREEQKVSSRDLPETGRRWKDVVFKGKKSLENSYRSLLQNGFVGRVELLGTCVQVFKTEKTTKLVDHNDTDIHYQTGIYNSTDVPVASRCQSFRLHGERPSDYTFRDLLSQQLFWSTVSTMNLVTQSKFINSICNDSTPNGGSSTGILYSQYFSCGGEPSFQPKSQRNSLLYLYRRRRLDKFKDLLKEVSGLGAVERRTRVHQPSARTKRIRVEHPADVVDTNYLNNEDSNPDVYVRTPYEEFTTAVVEKGILQWRIHSNDIDTVVMNDINLRTGIFQENKYCHLNMWHQPSLRFSCDCQMFCLKARSSSVSDHSAIDCCHIRFFKEFIQPVMGVAFDDPSRLPSTPIGMKVRSSIASLNTGIVQVDKGGKKFHTFSVISRNSLDCALVTLERNRFRCWKGQCRARKGHTRKTFQLNDATSEVCEHLGTIHSYQELWKNLVDPQSANDNADDSNSEGDEPGGPPMDYPVLADENTDTSVIYFDNSTGLWKANSISSNVPKTVDDLVLQKSIQQRLSINVLHPDYSVDEHGFFMRKTADGPQPFDLYPKLDKDLLCKCGENYWNSDHPDGHLVTRWTQPLTVYLHHGAAKYMVHSRDCLNRRDQCRILYTGAEDGLHILSTHTAAGDELGWEFIEMVTNCQSSISCFVHMKDKSYYGSKVSFMSRQTFTNWIFSWLVNFGTDFRKMCSVCGENPSVLAGDGTKLGIFFRHANVSPIEKPDSDIRVKPVHKRNDRQFFAYSTADSKEGKKEKVAARHCLSFFVARNSDKLAQFEKTTAFKDISNFSDEEKKETVLSCVPTQLEGLFSKYMDGNLEASFKQALSSIFLVFSTEVPLSSLINPRFLSLLSVVIADPANSLMLIHDDLPEIHRMLHIAVSLGGESVQLAIVLLQYCITQIEVVFKDDREPEAIDGIVKPYNPVEQGMAYYFTHHGGQIRHMPAYDLKDGEKKADISCSKNFPQAAKSGTTYLFLMFDPVHYGHCYGFHVITTSEGRKDAFAPPYLFMETAPHEMFYDFSCQLEEFSLNREPKFWKNTRFWHDIFHGFSHKCPFVYSSRRITYLHEHNTEICEQFNSYIQKIKFSARAMSQKHFIFYLQFFIDQWNIKKQAEYEKQLLAIRNLSL